MIDGFLATASRVLVPSGITFTHGTAMFRIPTWYLRNMAKVVASIAASWGSEVVTSMTPKFITQAEAIESKGSYTMPTLVTWEVTEIQYLGALLGRLIYGKSRRILARATPHPLAFKSLQKTVPVLNGTLGENLLTLKSISMNGRCSG